MYSIFLGILQGATEFLPISSSGHLVLAEHYLGLKEAGLPFDVALHMGTLTAILIYFRRDFLAMFLSLIKGKGSGKDSDFNRKLFLYICLATIPGVFAGLLFGKAAETTLRSPLVIAGTLSGAGLLLLLSERAGRRNRDFKSLTLADALIIGFSQAFAIVPGVSRSGITMATGLFRGMNRMAVARFSFLLSAPIIFGAGVYNIPKIMEQGMKGGQLGIYLSGFLSAAVSGYFVIAFLLRFVQTRSLDIFAYYRFILAAIVVAALILK